MTVCVLNHRDSRWGREKKRRAGGGDKRQRRASRAAHAHLDEVKRHLREPLLLQIRDDGLPAQRP
jgi:hypothetical protein